MNNICLYIYDEDKYREDELAEDHIKQHGHTKQYKKNGCLTVKIQSVTPRAFDPQNPKAPPLGVLILKTLGCQTLRGYLARVYSMKGSPSSILPLD